MNGLYPMIFKRKSFHLFRNLPDSAISADEIDEIINIFSDLKPLSPEIRTDIRIVSPSLTSCRRGEEYCILLYSEKKDNYLANIGYIGAQLDLFLVSKNIGTLWFGIGKVDEPPQNGLDFVIMIAIRKVNDERKFRKNMFLSKRKPVSQIWQGDPIQGVSEIVRFTPSACNTQPWLVKNNGSTLSVYRYKKPGKRGMMPANKVNYYNQIDIGIFLCFLELCLQHENIPFRREMFIDAGQDCGETLVANYHYMEG